MKERVKILTEVLENQLVKIEAMEKDDTKSDAFTLGYLQGTVRAVISELKQIQKLP
jgi:hypothetical protein